MRCTQPTEFLFWSEQEEEFLALHYLNVAIFVALKNILPTKTEI